MESLCFIMKGFEPFKYKVVNILCKVILPEMIFKTLYYELRRNHK